MKYPPFAKFFGSDQDNSVPYDYGNQWHRETHDSWSRITIGPTSRHIALLLELVKVLPPPYGILWILVHPSSGLNPGRYQSPLIEELEDLELLLWRYQEFFEQDGRHHIWVMSPHTGAQLIYDNHNLIYAYGPLDDFASVLQSEGLTEVDCPILIPSPHGHNYNPGNASTEDEFFAELEWQHFPLVEDHDDP